MRKATRIGLFSLVDHLADPTTGKLAPANSRLTEVIEQGVFAERVGFERFAIGEHHFCDYISPNPNLLLAAIAARTSRLKLFTAVTLIAIHDVIRLAEDISVLDNICAGRLELSFARGVSNGTSLVFGVSREEVYDRIAAKLDSLVAILSSGEIPSEAGARLPLSPSPVQRPHPPFWIGGGLSPESAEMAAARGMPLMLPSLFRYPEAYLPALERYRSNARVSGRSNRCSVGLPSFCWVKKESQAAKRQWGPRLEHYVKHFSGLRHVEGGPTDFESLLRGPAICGSPAEVVDRVSSVNEALGLDVHMFSMDVGGMPHGEVLDAMELMGAEVLPHFNRDAASAQPSPWPPWQ